MNRCRNKKSLHDDFYPTDDKEAQNAQQPQLALGRLMQLASVAGISGREDDVGKLVQEQLQPYVDDIHVDAMGNVIGLRKGKKPMLMLEAHMDEVGFMVQSVDAGGYVQFLPVGPIWEPPVVGQRMHLHTSTSRIDGIVGYKQGSSSVDYGDMYLDTGLGGEEAEGLIKVGDAITFRDGVTTLANGLLAGKAMDNRVSVFVLLEVARQLAKVNLTRAVAFCFSVRHEVGALGIPAIVTALEPDQAIVFDVALASDYPHGIEGRLGESDLNKGPVLWRGVDLSEAMAMCLERIADEEDIDIQRAAWNRFTPTNASHVMKVGPAVRTSLISIPHRYPHGPNSVVAQRDIANLIDLLRASISSRELMGCAN